MSAQKLSWPVPGYLSDRIAQFIQHHTEQCRNLGLLLDRYAPWQMDQRGHWDLTMRVRERRRGKETITPKRGGEAKGLWLSTSGLKGTEVDAPLRPNDQLDDKTLKAFAGRYATTLTAYPYRDFFQACPEWRFVVGLGGASVLETNMTLHHLYGIPIIPGSALKGVARAYAESVKGKEPNDPDVVAIFGKPPRVTPLQAGEIIFFDAIPITRPTFKLDVMNPHYPEYYQGDKPPADWQNPVPIYFLTVTNTTFLFTVAARTEEGRKYLGTVLKWLKDGLYDLGVGAKTAAGYGYFEEVSR